MTIVTTSYIDETRERINSCVNAARNTVCQNINIVQANIEQNIENTSSSIINHFTAWCESIGGQIGTLPTTVERVNESIHHLEHVLALRVQPQAPQLAPPPQRILFTNANAALEATRGLIAHVPPIRYALPPTTLPLDELYGQLHALHQNSLEWLTHIGSDTDQLLLDLRAFANTTAANHSQVANHVTSIRDELHALRGLPGLVNTLLKQHEANAQTLNTLMKDVAALKTLVMHSQTCPPNQTSNSTTSSGDKTTAHQISDLEPYQAQHPKTRCRTYGTIIYNGSSLHMPMDILGKPASTALQLHVAVKPSAQGTSVTYRLADNGALLLSDEIVVPNKLTEPLSDALSLLHSKCRNFIYTNKGNSLC
uniref:40 kDa protein n=1 Tax=Garlic virus C TaxID=12431 RepID=M9PQ25_9VIRU|nr:40 kDa Protein [Garlic virus C]